MLGSLAPRTREVTIVGAGIAGMLAAYMLDRRGYKVTLVESGERAGGLIRTDRTCYGIAEAAAHSLISTAAVQKLCRDLGVELAEVRRDSRARYIVRDGKLRRFPLTIREAASALGRAAFARAENHAGAQTLDQWSRRHLGKGALENLVTPFVRGIYGIQPDEVGVLAAFPSLVMKPGATLLGAALGKSLRGAIGRNGSRNGRREKEARRMVAPLDGMGDLVGRLERRLEQRLGRRFWRGVRAESLPDAPNVMLAVPAYVAAELLDTESPDLSQQLRDIEYTPMVSVTVFVSRSALRRPISGVGALVAAREGNKCLGILFNSSSFDRRVADESRFASLTVLLGGTSQPEWVSASDEEIKLAASEELTKLLGLKGDPLQIVINRWPRAIPQYCIRLPGVWQTARETWCGRPGHLLFGNYTGQVSLRGMIESAAVLAGEESPL